MKPTPPPTRPTVLTSLLCAVLLALCAGPARAEPGMQTVADPNGRYTIRFPQSWEIVSMNAKPLGGEIMRHFNQNFFSMLMAIDPGASAQAPTMLMVMSMELDHAVSPRTFGLMTRESMGKKFEAFNIVQEGTATIAKRPAFYRYFTMLKDGEEFYGVMAYFTVEKTGYIVFGMTQNNPATVRESFGNVSRILETFHPTAK